MAIFQGPPGRGNLYVALLSPAGELLVGSTFLALDLVDDFGAALLTATEGTIGGAGTGIYSWNPEQNRLLNDGAYPFRALATSISTPDEPAAAAGYLQWSNHATIAISDLVTEGSSALPVFQSAPGGGTLYVALYSEDGSHLLVDGVWTALAAVVDFSDALIAATELVVSGGGTGIYQWNPETSVAIADGNYPFRALSTADSTPDESPQAAGYLGWAAHAAGGLTDAIGGSANAQLQSTLAKILMRVSGAQIRATSAILQDGSLELVQGDDYVDVDNLALRWTINYPNLDDARVFFVMRRILPAQAGTTTGSTISLECEGSIDLSGDSPQAVVEIPAAISSQLMVSWIDEPFSWAFHAWIVTAEGKVHTFALGRATVRLKVVV